MIIMVLRKILGIDKIIDKIEHHTLTLQNLERQHRIINQQQFKLSQQHADLSAEHQDIISSTEQLKQLKNVLETLESKLKENEHVKSEITCAKAIVNELMSETDKKYIETIKNLKKVSANELALFLGVKRGTTSAKLSELYHKKLLNKFKVGKTVYYEYAEKEIEELEESEEIPTKKKKKVTEKEEE